MEVDPHIDGDSTDPEEIEPSPTSEPPEDVEIPVETVYGPNVAMTPLEPAAEKPAEKGQEELSEKKEKLPASASTPQKVIRIGAGSLLFGFLILLGLGVFLGKTLSPKSTKGENPTTAADERKSRSGFIQDLGLYKRENAYNAEEMASARLGLAQQQIVWITGAPENSAVLTFLAREKNRTNIPIYIICGNETPKRRIEAAKKFQIPIYQVKTDLELPYSILLIDNKLVLDISREHWVWETTEPAIIKETQKWAAGLLTEAKVVE